MGPEAASSGTTPERAVYSEYQKKQIRRIVRGGGANIWIVLLMMRCTCRKLSEQETVGATLQVKKRNQQLAIALPLPLKPTRYVRTKLTLCLNNKNLTRSWNTYQLLIPGAGDAVLSDILLSMIANLPNTLLRSTCFLKLSKLSVWGSFPLISSPSFFTLKIQGALCIQYILSRM